MLKHVNLTIQGSVQEVGFRWSAKNRADALGIKGIVKNFDDGSLYIEAEGEENNLEEFVEWCKVGPASAEVTSVSVEESEMKNFTNFEIQT